VGPAAVEDGAAGGGAPAPLARRLGVRTATAVVAGQVIAVGIFLTPAGMAKSLGSPLLLLLVWLASGLMAVTGALCYGELAGRYPEAGGGYVYLREAYGRRVAFLYGWKSLLVLDPGITAALAAGFGAYASHLFGLSPAGGRAAGVLAIAAAAAGNLGGVRLGAGLMRWLTFVKIGLLLAIVAAGFGLAKGDWSNFVPLAAQRAGSDPLPAALAGGFVSAFFALAGWWDLTKLAGEVREPARTLPRALVGGVGIVTGLYVLTSAVFFYLVPPERVTSGETFAAQAGEVLFGAVGGQVIAAVVAVSIFGSMVGMMMVAPRVYVAMARDGLFLESVGRVDERTGSPARATLLQAGLATVLVLTGSFDEIISYFIFVSVLFVAVTAASVFVFRGRGAPSAAPLPLFPVPPLVFLGLAAVLLALLAAGNPVRALIGLAVVALGVPVYRFAFGAGARSRSKEVS
jgi:APA family basic amino acid/polyamine antiporter